jgi:hypothetical protein
MRDRQTTRDDPMEELALVAPLDRAAQVAHRVANLGPLFLDQRVLRLWLMDLAWFHLRTSISLVGKL